MKIWKGRFYLLLPIFLLNLTTSIHSSGLRFQQQILSHFRGSECQWYYFQQGCPSELTSPIYRTTYSRANLTSAVVVLTMKLKLRFKILQTQRSFRSKNMIYHIFWMWNFETLMSFKYKWGLWIQPHHRFQEMKFRGSSPVSSFLFLTG